MSDYDDDLPQRRENLMQRRLRKARGEEVDDDPEPYNDYNEDDYTPRRLGGGYDAPRGAYPPAAGGGCAQAALYLTVGGLLALIIVGLFLNRAIGDLPWCSASSSSAAWRPPATPSRP
jgi:hypothetical protein